MKSKSKKPTSESPDKSEKPEKSEKLEKSEKPEKSEKKGDGSPGKSVKSKKKSSKVDGAKSRNVAPVAGESGASDGGLAGVNLKDINKEI